MFDMSVALLYQSSVFLSICKSIMIHHDSDNIVSIANCTICKYDTAEHFLSILSESIL